MSIIHISNAAASAAISGILNLLDVNSSPGILAIYEGSMPNSVDVAITDQTLLSSHILSYPAMGSVSSGVAVLDSISPDLSADASGTAMFGRFFNSSNIPIIDMDVGEADTSIIINSVNIVQGGVVVVNYASITMPTGS